MRTPRQALGGCLDVTIGSIPVARLPIADLDLWVGAAFLTLLAFLALRWLMLAV